MITVIYTCFIVISLGQSVLSCLLTPTQKAACDAVFDPSAMTYACCDCEPMIKFVEIQNRCLYYYSWFDVFTCSVATCVISNNYKLTDCNGNVDPDKVKALFDKLDSKYSCNTAMTQRIKDKCLTGCGYQLYVTSDPDCDTMKFEVCAFVNYLFACPKLCTESIRCADLARNVEICKPAIDQYLRNRNPGLDVTL